MNSRTYDSAFYRLRIPKFGLSLFLLLFLASCGGGSSSPSNVGGGYTLQVSGGTLNDGSGYNGLVVLATLRDSEGYGPTYPWTITITGPGIAANDPLMADYDMGQNYMSWEWAGFDPAGDYLVTAVNNDDSLTLSQRFSIKNSSTIARPSPSAGTSGTSITLSWSGLTNAGTYYYEVCPPSTSSETCKDGATMGLEGSAAFSSLDSGDYLIRVRAYISDRLALYSSASATPSLPPQENVSEYSFSFPVNGDPNAAKYTLKAAGGVLDYDLTGPNGAVYGLALWTSLTYNNAAPSGNWNITIKNPSGVEITNFIYPTGNEHYAYWYYGIEPVAGTYTITATYGSVTNTKTASVTLPNTDPLLLPLVVTELTSDISVTKQINNDRTISWNSVLGAGSYYLNIWAEEWNSTIKQWEYNEVYGQWVNGSTTSLVVPAATFTSGTQYDVYVTAHKVDMSNATPPSSTPTRADMSENYNPYSFTGP